MLLAQINKERQHISMSATVLKENNQNQLQSIYFPS